MSGSTATKHAHPMTDHADGYSEEEAELLIAVQKYKEQQGISFADATDIFKVMTEELGYRKK